VQLELPDDRQPVIIAALRTPVCRANGALKHLRSHELLAPVLRALLAETAVDPGEVADVVIGNAVGAGGNVARLAALEAGLPVTVPGLTVDRQCGSGLDAIVLASRLVAAGGGTYLAGGVESISTAPLRAHRNDDGEPAFFSRAQFAPHRHGDPDMGVAAENVAREYGISRARQDEFALRSHRRAVAAQAGGMFAREIVPLPGASGAALESETVTSDDGPRPKLSEALMATVPCGVRGIRLCHRRKFLLRRRRGGRRRHHLAGQGPGTGRCRRLAVLDTETAGVEPQLLGIGAAAAASRLLAAKSVEAADVDLVEFNEAFASQTLACLDHLGIGSLRANADGGALALGHAYGASGAVLVTRLLAQARHTPAAPVQEKLALAMISIAGGMGTAALFRHIRL
jgi:acetyl-CoA C-acetyltransferase